MSEKSFVDEEELKKINDEVYERGLVDREHLLKFLTIVQTSDALVIIAEVKKWLKDLDEDPKYDKVVFPKGDIDAIIGDLDSYGRVQPDTIMQFKQDSNRVPGQS